MPRFSILVQIWWKVGRPENSTAIYKRSLSWLYSRPQVKEVYTSISSNYLTVEFIVVQHTLFEHLLLLPDLVYHNISLLITLGCQREKVCYVTL